MSLTVQSPPPGSAAETLVEEVEGTEVAGRSQRQIAWSRFRRDRTGMVALIVVIFIFAVALAVPLIFRVFNLDPFLLDRNALDDATGGLPRGPWGGVSTDHLLGVEPGTGRDNLARLLDGLRISLFIALSATILTNIIGVFFGTVAGYSRGALDSVIGRLMDLTLAFPLLLIVLALSNVMTERITALGVPEGNPSRITYLILVLSIFGWPYLARLVRGQVLSLREREFVEAAVATGASTPRILRKEMLPNLWAPILVYSSLALPTYISTEAALSFLGVSVLPPTATLGAILSDSVKYFTVNPAGIFIPGTILVIIVLSVNLLGDSIRDALDPRSGRV